MWKALALILLLSDVTSLRMQSKKSIKRPVPKDMITQGKAKIVRAADALMEEVDAEGPKDVVAGANGKAKIIRGQAAADLPLDPNRRPKVQLLLTCECLHYDHVVMTTILDSRDKLGEDVEVVPLVACTNDVLPNWKLKDLSALGVKNPFIWPGSLNKSVEFSSDLKSGVQDHFGGVDDYLKQTKYLATSTGMAGALNRPMIVGRYLEHMAHLEQQGKATPPDVYVLIEYDFIWMNADMFWNTIRKVRNGRMVAADYKYLEHGFEHPDDIGMEAIMWDNPNRAALLKHYQSFGIPFFITPKDLVRVTHDWFVNTQMMKMTQAAEKKNDCFVTEMFGAAAAIMNDPELEVVVLPPTEQWHLGSNMGGIKSEKEGLPMFAHITWAYMLCGRYMDKKISWWNWSCESPHNFPCKPPTDAEVKSDQCIYASAKEPSQKLNQHERTKYWAHDMWKNWYKNTVRACKLLGTPLAKRFDFKGKDNDGCIPETENLPDETI